MHLLSPNRCRAPRERAGEDNRRGSKGGRSDRKEKKRRERDVAGRKRSETRQGDIAGRKRRETWLRAEADMAKRPDGARGAGGGERLHEGRVLGLVQNVIEQCKHLGVALDQLAQQVEISLQEVCGRVESWVTRHLACHAICALHLISPLHVRLLGM